MSKKNKQTKQEIAKEDFLELIRGEYPRELRDDSFTAIISRLSCAPRGCYIEASQVEKDIRENESLRNVSIGCVLEMLGFVEEDEGHVSGLSHFYATARWKRKTYFTVESEEILPDVNSLSDFDDEFTGEIDDPMDLRELTRKVLSLEIAMKKAQNRLDRYEQDE